jgi:hypothetical protein
MDGQNSAANLSNVGKTAGRLYCAQALIHSKQATPSGNDRWLEQAKNSISYRTYNTVSNRAIVAIHHGCAYNKLSQNRTEIDAVRAGDHLLLRLPKHSGF